MTNSSIIYQCNVYRARFIPRFIIWNFPTHATVCCLCNPSLKAYGLTNNEYPSGIHHYKHSYLATGLRSLDPLFTKVRNMKRHGCGAGTNIDTDSRVTSADEGRRLNLTASKSNKQMRIKIMNSNCCVSARLHQRRLVCRACSCCRWISVRSARVRSLTPATPGLWGNHVVHVAGACRHGFTKSCRLWICSSFRRELVDVNRNGESCLRACLLTKL